MSFKDIELCEDNEYRVESLEVGLTSNCNFKCQYCCAYKKNDNNYITAGQVIDIIKDLPHLKRVKLSGGEVLLFFDECARLVEYCSSKGIKTQINTNGSVLDEQKVKILESVGLDTIHISLNFTNPEDYFKFYGLSTHVFECVLNSITLCQKSSIDTVVETILFDKTKDTIVDICNFVYGLGVRKHEIQYGVTTECSNWSGGLLKNDIERILEDILNNKKEDTELYFSCIRLSKTSPFYERIRRLIEMKTVHFSKCIEGRKQLHLHSNGDILICELGYPVVVGNVYKGTSLQNIFNEMPEELKNFIKEHNCSKYCNLS